MVVVVVDTVVVAAAAAAAGKFCRSRNRRHRTCFAFRIFC
jgi:hypothetical protein